PAPGMPLAPTTRPGSDLGGRGRKRRAGRNLPAAIGVGLVLGTIVISSVYLWRPAFIVVVVAAAAIAIWEVTRAVASSPRSGFTAPSGAGQGAASPGPRPVPRSHPPVLPLIAGAAVMITLAWFAGVEALTLGLTITVLAVLIWRLADGPGGYLRDVVAATLVAVYVPFLAGFAVLLAKPDDGPNRVIATLVAVVLSDTGGYVAGVFFGRHPMAPTVSPKKSWEGAVGSLLAAGAGGAVVLMFGFDRPWWDGVIFGVAVSLASILGDLAESLLKRDLGVKDMSQLLPGHGGIMDRLDSILFALPCSYLLLTWLAPAGG
ncbi:MAG: phosphatidate cytidylyltransferase, partial [Micromonosporaceae bacterium]|nr:phosphatidate cytidylyltransferase [Micromonosporaceae bacterium]